MRRPLTMFAVLALGVVLSTDGVLGAETNSGPSGQNAQAAAAAMWYYIRSLLPRPVVPRPPQGTQPQPDAPAPPEEIKGRLNFGYL